MAMKASTAKLIASDFVTLDLKRIRRFILEAAAEGAIAVLISTIIELLTRMRDLNQELMRQLAWKNRKRTKRKKPDQANRDAHGRPKFPEHIPRVEGDVELVAGDARVCPHCRTECA